MGSGDFVNELFLIVAGAAQLFQPGNLDAGEDLVLSGDCNQSVHDGARCSVFSNSCSAHREAMMSLPALPCGLAVHDTSLWLLHEHLAVHSNCLNLACYKIDSQSGWLPRPRKLMQNCTCTLCLAPCASGLVYRLGSMPAAAPKGPQPLEQQSAKI